MNSFRNAVKGFIATFADNYDTPENYHNFALRSKRKLRAIEITQIIQFMFGKDKNLRVLDIAGGTGIISAEMIRAGYETITTDINEGQLKFGIDQGLVQNGTVADMNNRLPFKDSAFNVITVFGSRRYFTKEGLNVFIVTLRKTTYGGGWSKEFK